MLPDNNSDALILNVDDSDGARYAKSRILQRAGFKVIEASNGGDALLRARQDRPNLILLDVKLPDINGLEVCRQLKGGAETNTILVLQTSASCIGTADKIRALDGGADNYLVEPIEADELIANVKALLRLGRVERELRDVDRRKDEFLATLAHQHHGAHQALLLQDGIEQGIDAGGQGRGREVVHHGVAFQMIELPR